MSKFLSIKALEWQEIGGGYYRAAAPLFGNIRIEKYGKRFTVCYSLPGYSDTFTPGDFATADEAKAAAQADYEQRIRSALVAAPSRDDVVREDLAGEIAYALTTKMVIDMPTARAAVDAALRSLISASCREPKP